MASEQLKIEHTLDPILPSNSDSSNAEEMSYLYGRDPSILAGGQRPGISVDIKKNLFSVYEIEESIQSETGESLTELSSQTVKVYLRLKPFSRNIKLTEQQENAYQITNANTLLTKLPILETPMVSMVKLQPMEETYRKYIFTKTFGPETTQLNFFDHAVASQLSKFIEGQNCTIMTYGTTNSGKSYTLQGTTTSPGIIPRSLEFVFANINPRPSPRYKPIHNCDVIVLSSKDKDHELEQKNRILAFGLPNENQYISAYKKMQKLLEEESSIRVGQTSDAHYSVWVSFAEIYNETIYDLLSNDCRKRRRPLKLATDSNGRTFIKGLKTIYVNSGSEAFQILMAGQDNLKVAATALNPRSSRSHCIFTIKLLKYNKENDPDSVEVSTFSFGDLAGSERLKKTLNVGDRLKEAQNINTSLLVLGRCLKSIYDGQSVKQRNEHVAPFRESKLTHLFQHALSGKEPIALIVNVNPSPNLYVETQNVLNFAAIAKKIVLQPLKTKRRRSTSRFSQIVDHNTKNGTNWDDTDALDKIPENSLIDSEHCTSVQSEDYEELLDENEKLRKEISALKSSALNREFEIRQEMANMYSEILKKVEDRYKNQLKDVEEQQEDLMEYNVNRVETYWREKIIQITSRKRSRNEYDDDIPEETVDNIADLKAENLALTSKVTSLKETLKDTRKQKDLMESKKNTAQYELSLVKKELEKVNNLIASMQVDLTSNGESLQCINELRNQVAEMDEKNKKLSNYLKEAERDYTIVKAEIESKDHQIKEREYEIRIQSEKIRDLESHFENANLVLMDKIKNVEQLEDKLDRQSEELINAEARIRELTENAKKVDESSDKHDQIIIELKEKLECYENKNLSLSEALSQRSSEVESLKRDLNDAKVYLSETDEKLKALETQMASSKTVDAVQSNTSIGMEKLEYCDSDCQTTSMVGTNQINQTSFIDTVAENINEELKMKDEQLLITEKELEKIKENYNELQQKFKDEQQNVTNLSEQLSDGEKIQEKLTVEIEEFKERVNELNRTINLLQTAELSYKDTIEKLKNESDLNTLKCQTEHVDEIAKLKVDLSTAEQFREELAEQFREEINKLKQDLSDRIQYMEERITKLDCKLENLQTMKTELENKLQTNLQQIEVKNRELQESTKKLQDKDDEISQLQKKIKDTLQSAANVENTMEKEFKKVLRDLESTKRSITLKTETIEQLQSQITEYETLKQTVAECERQIEEITKENDSLQKTLNAKDQDMKKFTQNRDELIEKYEKSLDTLQEKLSQSEQENSEYEKLLVSSTTTPRNTLRNKKLLAIPSSSDRYNLRDNKAEKEKVECFDDEVVTERRGKSSYEVVTVLDSSTDETSMIQPSGSESIRATRSTVKTMAEKRSTRKKKLFTMPDNSFTDVLPGASEPPPSPPTSTRSTRTRRRL